MHTLLRAVLIYLALLVILRASGKRSLAQITTFDLILILILGESTQQALTGNDFSITTGMLLIASLVGIDMTLSFMQDRWPGLGLWLDGKPIIIVEDGRPLRDRMHYERVGDDDVLAAAREEQGLERMEQIKFAVLERSGRISIIPKPEAKA